MSYTLTVDGTSFGEVYRFSAKKENNQVSEAEIECYDLDATQEGKIVYGNWVVLNNGTRDMWKGIIVDYKYGVDGDVYLLKCEGFEVKLFSRISYDETSTDGRMEWTNTSMNTIITELIDGVISIGTLDADLPAISFRAEYDSILGALSGLARIAGKDWWVSESAGILYFNMSDRGSATSQQTFTMGSDSHREEEEQNLNDVYNVLYVLGYGDGINQLRGQGLGAVTDRATLSADITEIDTSLTISDTSFLSVGDIIWIGREKCEIASVVSPTELTVTRGVNSDKISPYPHKSGILVYSAEYTESIPQTSSSIDVNGIQENRYIDRSITDQNTIDRLADKLIQKYEDSGISGKFEYLGDNLSADVGDVITIVDYDGSSTERVLKSWSYSEETASFEIVYISKGVFEDKIVSLEKNMDVNNPYGQGSTNIFQIQSYENCDSSSPLHVRFRIPDDVIAINKVLLSFKRQPFRLYSKQITSDGDHNHNSYFSMAPKGSSDFDQASDIIYLMGAIDNYSGIIVSGNDTSISKSVANATSNVSHTHPILLGINNDTGFSATHGVIIEAGEDGSVTSVSGSPFTTDENEINILSHVGEAGKWYDIVFTPEQYVSGENTYDRIMRIEANVYVKCFIRSN